jgi:hypothetical protein
VWNSGFETELPLLPPPQTSILGEPQGCSGCRHKEQTIAALLGTDSGNPGRYGPLDPQSATQTMDAPRRQKRRGHFADERKHQETAATRRIGACTRCRKWKKRVSGKSASDVYVHHAWCALRRAILFALPFGCLTLGVGGSATSAMGMKDATAVATQKRSAILAHALREML